MSKTQDRRDRERTSPPSTTVRATGRFASFTSFFHFAISDRDVLVELPRRAAHGSRAVGREPLSDVRRLERLDDGLVQLLHDGLRHFRRDDHAVPLIDLEAGHAGLGDGRQIDGGRALRRRDRDAAQLARLHLRARADQRAEADLHLARQHRGDHRSGALVRHVHDLHAGHVVEAARRRNAAACSCRSCRS